VLATRRPLARPWLFAVLLIGLLIDTAFLLWQVLYWPCSSCLAVALLLAACMLGFLWVFPAFRGKGVWLALLVWFGVFAAVGAEAGKELWITPWPMQGAVDAPVLVYFSPTCPACEKTVLDILDHPDLALQTAFLPVAKNDEDLRRLARALTVHEDDRVASLFSGEQATPVQPGALLRWRLARNKMSLARLGADTVPLVLTPQLVQITPAPASPLPFLWDGPSPQDLLGIPQLQQGCSATTVREDDCEE
jgi:hypothetical protein